jgi:hypothetical protein
MGLMEAEMQRLLGWVNPRKLAEIQAIDNNDQARNHALSDLIRQYERARLEDERVTYARSCVGEKVWIHLPGDYRMNLYEGVVVSIEVQDGSLVAKLKDPHYDELIEFDPTLVMPHYYRKRRTDGRVKGTVEGLVSENVRDDSA